MKRVIFILGCMLLFPISIKAVETSAEYFPNVYGNKYEESILHSGRQGYLWIDGELGYCLDPYIDLGTTYIQNNRILEQFTNHDLDYFKLLDYEVKKHKLEKNYYLAAQELIWRRITGGEVNWTTEYLAKGDKIDIEAYKNVISENVKREQEGPKFNTNIISGEAFTTVQLFDYNNVLEHYEIVNDSKHDVEIIDNVLVVRINNDVKATIQLKFKTDGETKSYQQNGKQNIASFGGYKKDISLDIEPTGEYQLKLRLLHFFGNNQAQGIFKFKILNTDTNQFIKYNNEEVLVTNLNGEYESVFGLPKGHYQIINVDVSEPFLLNDGVSFVVDSDTINYNGVMTVEQKVSVPSGTIHFSRYQNLNEQGTNYSPGANLLYQIYANEDVYDINDGHLIKKGTFMGNFSTNSNGQGTFNNLPLGSYYLLETAIDSNDNYVEYSSPILVMINYVDNKTKNIDVFKDIRTNFPTVTINLKSIKEHFVGLNNGNGVYEYIGQKGVAEIYADNVYYVFKVFEQGEKIGAFNYNEIGSLDIMLPKGSYYLRVDSVNYYFSVDETKTINKQIITDLNKANIIVQIVDEENNSINGEKLTILSENKVIGSLLTNEGYGYFNNLPFGSYTIFDEVDQKEYDIELINDKYLKIIRKIAKEEINNDSQIEEISPEISLPDRLPLTTRKNDFNYFWLLLGLIIYKKI